MAGVNKVILVGNLGNDPEVRHLDGGSVVAKVSIATSETYKKKETGERITNTEWHRLEMWEGLAKIAEQYLKKGDQIYVEGKLRTQEYVDKDNITRYTTVVRVTDMKMLGKVGAGEGGNNNMTTTASSTKTEMNSKKTVPVNAETISSQDEDDDELPF